MDLQDIVDGTEGSNIFKAPSPAAELKLKKSFSWSDVLTASVTRDRLKMKTSSVNIDQVKFDSDTNSATTNDTWKNKADAEENGLKSSIQYLEDSYTDKCEVLPWPRQEEDGSTGNIGEDLLEPFQSSSLDEGSCLASPDVENNNYGLRGSRQKDDDKWLVSFQLSTNGKILYDMTELSKD